MQIVIADTGPVNYLVLIGYPDILPVLFDQVIIPDAVRDELSRKEAPERVRTWIQAQPLWVIIHTHSVASFDPAMQSLDGGEIAALEIALAVAADLVLMDDRVGVTVARAIGLRVIGTLRILDLGARRGLFELSDAFNRLKSTNFRYRQETMDALLADFERDRRDISPLGG